MAARSHVDTSATVNERRLRPIYDCLDNGNNKKALHEAEKLLKKQKEFLCAKVLKALALIRLGRQEESLATLKEVHTEGPTDDATLQAMTICYRELHRAELIADAYETAVKKDPQNEELLTHLFMSYVRLGEYKKQQQTAMMLYKLKPKNPYYFWAVMSIVMQASTGDEKLARNMLLPLAERMTDKFVKENKIEAEAEVQLYLMILENQEKYGEALQVLNGPLGEKKLTFYLDFLPQRRAELLAKLKRWPEANSAYKQLIISNPDQWSYYVGYFNSVLQLVNSQWHPNDESSSLHPPVDYSYEMTIEFISSLVQQQNNSNDNRILRGPYLAQLDLLRCLLERKSSLASRLGTMVDILMSYYEKFGSKPSCCLDMAHLVSSLNLSQDDIEKLLEKITFSIDVKQSGENSDLPKDIKQMQRHLCYCQLSHYVGIHDKWSSEQKLALVNDLIKRYHHGLQFGSNLLQTDFQPCDNYCLLAAHILIKMCQNTGDDSFLVHAMVLLEQGLKNSPSNFQMKLMLIKLYNIIGAVGVSCDLYESVDVKHIQQETLGYLISHPLVTGAHYSLASSAFGNALRFFTGNYKDTVDYLISCYKFGSFTKIPEIVSFREKLNNSLQYASVVVEKTILDLVLETKSHQDSENVLTYVDIDPEKDKIKWKDLTDNRDVTVFRVWDIKQKEILEDLKTCSFSEEVNWLKLRNLLMRTIAATYCLTKAPPDSSQHHNDMANGEKRGMPEVLSDLVSSLKEHVSSIDSQTLANSHFPIQSPGPSRLRLYLQVDYVSILVSLVELVLYLYRLTEGPTAGQSEEKYELQVIANLKESFNGLVNRVLQNIAMGKNVKLSCMKTLLEDLSNCIETLSLAIILLGFGHAMLKPARSALVKKGRKKDTAPPIGPETFHHFSDLVTGMEQAANAFQNALEYLDDSTFSICVSFLSIEEPKVNLEGCTELMKQVKENVEKSYHLSTKELGDILQNKAKYLHSLKW